MGYESIIMDLPCEDENTREGMVNTVEYIIDTIHIYETTAQSRTRINMRKKNKLTKYDTNMLYSLYCKGKLYKRQFCEIVAQLYA